MHLAERDHLGGISEVGYVVVAIRKRRLFEVTICDIKYEALTKKVENLEDLLAMKVSLSAPEGEAVGLEDYERQRVPRV